MALALHNTGKSNRSLLIAVTKAALLKRVKCFPVEGFETDYLRTSFRRQNVCPEQKTARSTRIVGGLLGAVEQEVADRIISLISPCAFGLAVSHRSHDYVGRVQRRHSRHSPPPPSMDCRHLSSPENSWPFNVVLYRTTTLDTHPQNVC